MIVRIRFYPNAQNDLRFVRCFLLGKNCLLTSFFFCYILLNDKDVNHNVILQPINQTPYYNPTGRGQAVRAAVQHDNRIKGEFLWKRKK